MNKFVFQPKSLKQFCECFAVYNFKIVFLEPSEEDNNPYFKVVKDKVKLSFNMFQAVFLRSQELGLVIQTEYLLPLYLEMKNCDELILSNFYIQNHFDFFKRLLEGKNYKVISITFAKHLY